MRYKRVVGNSGAILFYNNKTSDVNDHTQTNEPDESLSVYPNPFNNTAKIHFVNPGEQTLEIKVHNLLGQEILVYPMQFYNKGAHTLTFNASQYPSGIYLITIKGKNYLQTTKCILLK